MSGLFTPGPPDAPVSRRQWIILGVVVVLGAALRLWYLSIALESPGFAWEDPDGYINRGLRLIRRGEWHWTFNAVAYSINGQRHALPPGYSIFLSLIALFPGFPVSALVIQLVLSVFSITLVFALGRVVHSSTSGLIASTCYALWVPNVFNVWSTSQETLYIPLILGVFLLLGRAINRDGGPVAFGIAGLLCGVAALTRSMPIFFVLPAVATHIAIARERRRAFVQGVAFVAGFLLLTTPYSIGLSRHFGAVTIIDTHGSIHFAAGSGPRAPGPIETVRALSTTIAADPARYFLGCVQRARSLLHVNGGRIVQIYVVGENRRRAALWKTIVHAGTDGLLIFGVVLAPLGAVLCRRPSIAVLLLLWAVVNVVIASVGGFGGARLRTPFEPLLFVLAATVCAGGWRRPRYLALAAALSASGLAAVAVLPQLASSLQARADYGMRWPSVFNRQTGHFREAAGFNLQAPNGLATFAAAPVANLPVNLHVSIKGVTVRTIELPAGELSTVYAPWPGAGLAFVELEVEGSAGSDKEVRIVKTPE
jgi:hypothetical protein